MTARRSTAALVSAPTTDSRGATPQRRKSYGRREEVLDTAARMFTERGYEATTTGDIGEALGILKGSIYYYITSKEQLLFDIIERYHNDTRAYFDRILHDDAAPLDKLRELIITETAHAARHLNYSSLFYTEWRALSPERRAPILLERDRHEQAVEGWIEQAQLAQQVRADVDPKITMLAIFGMVNSVYRWFTADGRRSAEQIGEEFAALVLRGLLERPNMDVE